MDYSCYDEKDKYCSGLNPMTCFKKALSNDCSIIMASLIAEAGNKLPAGITINDIKAKSTDAFGYLLNRVPPTADFINYMVKTMNQPVKADYIINYMPLGGTGLTDPNIFAPFKALVQNGASVLNKNGMDIATNKMTTPLMKAFTQFEPSQYLGDRTMEPVTILLDAGATLDPVTYNYAKSKGKLCAVKPDDSSCATVSGAYQAIQKATAAAAVTPTNSSAMDPVLDQWEAALPAPTDNIVVTPAGDAYKTQALINAKLFPIFEKEVDKVEETGEDSNNVGPRIQRVRDYINNQFAAQGQMMDEYNKLDALLNRMIQTGAWSGGAKKRSRLTKTRRLKKQKRKAKYTKRK